MSDISQILKDLDMSIEELVDLALAKAKGRIVILPCKPGDKVYVKELDEDKFEAFYAPIKVSEYMVNHIDINRREIYTKHLNSEKKAYKFSFDQIGKIVFLRKEDAEKSCK